MPVSLKPVVVAGTLVASQLVTTAAPDLSVRARIHPGDVFLVAIMIANFHAEGQGAFRNRSADAAKTENAECFAADRCDQHRDHWIKAARQLRNRVHVFKPVDGCERRCYGAYGQDFARAVTSTLALTLAMCTGVDSTRGDRPAQSRCRSHPGLR